MTPPEEFAEIKRRNDRACAEIADIAREGRTRWRMSIPARPDRDSDLIISAALKDTLTLGAEVDRLQAEAPQCNGKCLRASDVLDDLNRVIGNPVARAHRSCPLHGDLATVAEELNVALSQAQAEVDDALHDLQIAVGTGFTTVNSAAVEAGRRIGVAEAEVERLRTMLAPVMDLMDQDPQRPDIGAGILDDLRVSAKRYHDSAREVQRLTAELDDKIAQNVELSDRIALLEAGAAE